MVMIAYDETQLCQVDGRWRLTNNCYGLSLEKVFGKPVRTAISDASAAYFMYYDDFCCDLFMFRVNGRWGLLLKSGIIGMGCANYQSSGNVTFIYDDFLFLVGGDLKNDLGGPQSAEFYSKIRGLIAVKQNGLWGILKVYKKEFDVLLYKGIVPCKYRTVREAASGVKDLTDNEKAEIAKVLKEMNFRQKVRRKIDGWYQKEEYYTEAVNRSGRLSLPCWSR